MVAAAVAAVGLGGDSEVFQVFGFEQRGTVIRLRFVLFQGQDGGAVSAHQTGDIRTDDVPFQQFFHVAEHGIVVEGAALHHNVVAQFPGIFQLHNLEKGILDYGKADACGNIRQGRPFLLGLLHP